MKVKYYAKLGEGVHLEGTHRIQHDFVEGSTGELHCSLRIDGTPTRGPDAVLPPYKADSDREANQIFMQVAVFVGRALDRSSSRVWKQVINKQYKDNTDKLREQGWDLGDPEGQ